MQWIIRPLILSNTTPEEPQSDHWEQYEKCFEQRAINLAMGRVAQMYADDKVKDLTDDEQEAWYREENQRPCFLQNTEYQHWLQDEVCYH